MSYDIPVRGSVYGTAGSSLTDAAWAASENVAKTGQAGEARTAAAIDPIIRASNGAAVFHDLRIPIKNLSANIDHVVVSGRRVLILDTKVWKPGFYCTAFGRVFRGTSRFTHAEKQTLALAKRSLSSFLASTPATVATPVTVIWPSTTKRTMSIWALRLPGSKAIHAAKAARLVKRYVGRSPADPAIVAKLGLLLNGDAPQNPPAPESSRRGETTNADTTSVAQAGWDDAPTEATTSETEPVYAEANIKLSTEF